MLAKNERLEKDLQKNHQRASNKILSDSILGDEATSHSTLFKLEDFYQILEGKNE